MNYHSYMYLIENAIVSRVHELTVHVCGTFIKREKKYYVSHKFKNRYILEKTVTVFSNFMNHNKNNARYMN